MGQGVGGLDSARSQGQGALDAANQQGQTGMQNQQGQPDPTQVTRQAYNRGGLINLIRSRRRG